MIWLLLFHRYQDKATASYTVIRKYYDKFNEDQQKMEDEKNKLEDSIQKYKERQEAKAAFGFFKCIVGKNRTVPGLFSTLSAYLFAGKILCCIGCRRRRSRTNS